VVPIAIELPESLGRRERKKQATRDALVDAALALFEARGVDLTTIEEISNQVDVSSRTFHRYFGCKEDVLFADSAERQERFAAALAGRPREEPLLESLRAAACELAAMLVEQPEREFRRLRLIEQAPSLFARHLQASEEWAEAVAGYCATRLAMRADDALPVLLAACTSAAMRTARRSWARQPSLDLVAEVDRCFQLLSHLAEVTMPVERRSRRR
jgi:AcrR family transcriptional regulator